MVWDYVAVIRELLVGNYALSALLSDLPIEHLPHLGWRPEFPVSPRVMWILDTLNAETVLQRKVLGMLCEDGSIRVVLYHELAKQPRLDNAKTLSALNSYFAIVSRGIALPLEE